MRRRLEASRVLYATKRPSSLDTRYPGATSHSVMLELRSSTISVGIVSCVSVALTSSPRNTEKSHSMFFQVRRVRDLIIGSSSHTELLACLKCTLAWRGPLESPLGSSMWNVRRCSIGVVWKWHHSMRTQLQCPAGKFCSIFELS
jgi:hypothetical protein